LTKAARLFETAAPWYNQEKRWVKIAHGEREGCRYEDAVDLDIAREEYEAILEDAARGEETQREFEFDDEDFFEDADLTEEEIQAIKEAEEETRENARGSVEDARTGAYTFL
jgi:hypothetical protein